MHNAKEIRERCEEDIKKLQESCQHPTSTWILECWAPGHITGQSLLMCDICEKVLDRRKDYQ